MFALLSAYKGITVIISYLNYSRKQKVLFKKKFGVDVACLKVLTRMNLVTKIWSLYIAAAFHL